MTKKEAFDFLDRMARGIAVMFGEQCETIVHEMDGQKVKNLAIYNGHVSGRTTGSTLSIYGRDTMMDEEDPKVNLDHGRTAADGCHPADFPVRYGKQHGRGV